MPRLSQSKAEQQKKALLLRLCGEHVVKLRIGWEPQRIAASYGLTSSTYYRRLAKPGSLTLDELQAIANTLNISVSALLGDNT